MGKLIWTPATLLAPVPPVLVTCGTLEHPNVLTVAWTGIINSEPAMTYVSIRPSRYSHGLIKESGEFVINLTSKAMVAACDYCGVRSGAKEDKIANSGLTVMPADKVSAPIISKSPLSIECKVTQVISLGSHDMFLAEIVAVDVDEQYVNRDGKLRLDKAELVAYAHGAYYELGKQLGTFGFSVCKKPQRSTTPKTPSAAKAKRKKK
ncbi:MAG: flavin reductase family protein [Hydrogenoanaerobacterium sp.]